jgi:peptidoglycan/xylan/chitin deacetylase (PgdA/CDA1 family)
MTLPGRALCLLAVLCAGCRGRPAVPILNYHSVGDRADEYTVTDAQFGQQLDWVQQQGLQTLALHEALAGNARAVVLTFDDGKEDALTRVLPALRKRGMRAAFFVITALVGQPGYLTWDGVRALRAAGMEIGSHTAHHARLADLSDAQVRAELTESKRALEAQLHGPVDLLAYPYNSVRQRVRDAAKEAGYRIAVSGVVHGGRDPLDLLRTSVTGLTTMEQFQQIVSH